MKEEEEEKSIIKELEERISSVPYIPINNEKVKCQLSSSLASFDRYPSTR